MGPVEKQIRDKLNEAFTVEHLELINESDMHSGPPGRESHFKLLLVSKDFDGLNRVQRQQKVYGVLKEEMANLVHALSQQTFTSTEWAEKPQVNASPDCSHKK